MPYSAGFEFEYALVSADPAGPPAFHDFTDLDFEALQRALSGCAGSDDPGLVRGDLGIKSGYCYLEGDERFTPEGELASMRVKGVEVRTPVSASLTEAADRLLEIQADLEQRLAPLGLRLGIVGWNPVRETYVFDPPLNEWELRMRAGHREYDHAEVSNLSYGPDVNLSFPGLAGPDVVALTRRLTRYSPFLVPFSFSSPFHAGTRWRGPSKRTYERTWRRVATRCFTAAPPPGLAPETAATLVLPPRIPAEEGRIEFKAYDAFCSRDLLLAGAALVLGVCLATDLPGVADVPSKELHQRAGLAGFADDEIAAGSAEVVAAARRALAGRPEAILLDPLEPLLHERRTPADTLLAQHSRTGLMFRPEGLR